MAKSTKTGVQNYPRIQDQHNKYYNCLDDSTLVPHRHKISIRTLQQLIGLAIKNANKKSSREILSLPKDANTQEVNRLYEKHGKALFHYFKKYCGDPASTAHQIKGKSYEEVGREQFRNRTLQKERMNSGWRYQFLASDCAQKSKRFKGVSDIGAAEGDFNAVIEFLDKSKIPLTLYVSVKNRDNTMGGQDWPKAIQALENYAKNDKNRIGPYCCIFGFAMNRGSRSIKHERRTNKPHSVNTEIWYSDFFWPFFANYSYEEIMAKVLDVLMESHRPDQLIATIDIPNEVIESFGQCCKKAGLIHESGYFNDPYKLVRFFCQ